MPVDRAAASELNADLAAFLKRRDHAVASIDLFARPLDEARRHYRFRSLFGQDTAPSGLTEDIRLPDGPLLRIHDCDCADGMAVLFVHGGGWRFGDLDTHDSLMRNLGAHVGARVVGVDYRRAPETPHPGAIDDCLRTVRWMRDDLGIRRIVIAGDSAGASLALSVGIALAKADAPPLEALVLMYGCFAPEFDTDSHAAFGDGRFGLSTNSMRRYWDGYLGETDRAAYTREIDEGLAGLPPVLLGIAGLDPLRDDGYRLADKLARAGVPLRIEIWPGCPHGFLQLPSTLASVEAAFAGLAKTLAALRNQPLRAG